MAVGVLGGAELGEVGPEIERLLQQAGGESVVHGDDTADAVGNIADRLDIEDLQQRIGRRFEPDKRRFELRDEAVVRRVGEVGVFDRDVEATQHAFEEPVGRAVDLLLGEDDIARLQ